MQPPSSVVGSKTRISSTRPHVCFHRMRTWRQIWGSHFHCWKFCAGGGERKEKWPRQNAAGPDDTTQQEYLLAYLLGRGVGNGTAVGIFGAGICFQELTQSAAAVLRLTINSMRHGNLAPPMSQLGQVLQLAQRSTDTPALPLPRA